MGYTVRQEMFASLPHVIIVAAALGLTACPDGVDPVRTDARASPRDAAARPDVSYPPTTPPLCPKITPTSPPAALGLDAFYRRYVDAGGIPIVGSAKVPDAAFAQAYYVVTNMLASAPCVRQALAASGIRIGIIARAEVTTDMPEYKDMNRAFPGTCWNKRGRGFGATMVRPLTTGAVDNLLQDTSDPWRGENILLHELAHTFFEFGVRDLRDGPKHGAELTGAYAAAIKSGLWKKTYAATNEREYWAEGVQSWFDNNLQASPANGVHNHVDTRRELETYDARLAALIKTLTGTRTWPAYCNATDDKGPAWKDPTKPPPPASSCPHHTAWLRDLGCAKEKATPSIRTTTTARIQVANRSHDKTYSVWWLDLAGVRRGYGTIRPRSTRTLSTYTSHTWLFTDAAGRCIGLYQASHLGNRIALGP